MCTIFAHACPKRNDDKKKIRRILTDVVFCIELELHDNDDEIRLDDDGQRYTVHVQAVPEPVTLPAVHIPSRNALQLPKACSAAKHLPRLVQTGTNNNHHCQSQLGNVFSSACTFTSSAQKSEIPNQ